MILFIPLCWVFALKSVELRPASQGLQGLPGARTCLSDSSPPACVPVTIAASAGSSAAPGSQWKVEPQ